MDITQFLCMIVSAKNAAEELLRSQTKEELHAKVECIKQCIDHDRSISDYDKKLYKNCFDHHDISNNQYSSR